MSVWGVWGGVQQGLPLQFQQRQLMCSVISSLHHSSGDVSDWPLRWLQTSITLLLVTIPLELSLAVNTSEVLLDMETRFQ